MPQTITLVLDDTQGSLAEFNTAFEALVKGVESLGTANTALQTEVSGLKADNTALQQKVTYLENEHVAQCERTAALEFDVNTLKGELATVKANLLKAADALDD